MNNKSCDLCDDTGCIAFFFACDDVKDCICPACNGGNWEEYNQLVKEFQELLDFNVLYY